MSHDARNPVLLEQRIAEDPTIVFRHPETVVPDDTALDLSHLPHLRLFLAFGSQTHTDLGRLAMRRFPRSAGWAQPIDAQLAGSILGQWPEGIWLRLAKHPSPDVRKVMAEATGFLLQAFEAEAKLVVDSFAASMSYTRRKRAARDAIDRLAPVHAVLLEDENATVRAVARSADARTSSSQLHDLSLGEDEGVHRAVARNAASAPGTLDLLVARSSTATRRWLATRDGLSAESWDTLVEIDDVDVLLAALLFAPARTVAVATQTLGADLPAMRYPLDVSLAVARSSATSSHVLEALSVHEAEAVRLSVAQTSSPHISSASLQQLAKDTSERVRAAVASRADLPDDVLRSLVQDSSTDVRSGVAARSVLPDDVSAALRRDRSFEVQSVFRDWQERPQPPSGPFDSIYEELRATIANLEDDFVLDSAMLGDASVYVIIHKDVLLRTIDWAERTRDLLGRLKATEGDFEAADILLRECTHARISRAWDLLLEELDEPSDGGDAPPERDWDRFWRTFTNLIAVDAHPEILRREVWLANARWSSSLPAARSPLDLLENVFDACAQSMRMAPIELAACSKHLSCENLTWFEDMECAWDAAVSCGAKISFDTGLATRVFDLTSAASLVAER